MLVKGLTENRDRAWALTSHVVGQLPLVLAEMRGVDAETAQKELDDTGGESKRAQRTVAEGITSPMGHGTLESTALVPAATPAESLEIPL